MKTLKEELIDFLDWLDKNGYELHNVYEIMPEHVDLYLKSINSLPNGEASSVSTNELTKEVCYHESIVYGYINGVKIGICEKCKEFI